MKLKKERLALLHRTLETNRRLMCTLDEIYRDHESLRDLVEVTLINCAKYANEVSIHIKKLLEDK